MKYKNLFSVDYESEEDDDQLWTPNKRPKNKEHSFKKEPKKKKISDVNNKMEIPSKKKVKFYVVTFLDKPYKNIASYVCIPSTWLYCSKHVEHEEKTRIAALYPHKDGNSDYGNSDDGNSDDGPIVTNFRVKTEEKPHKNWKMYLADIVHKSETYDEAQAWIKKKKNENSSNDAATSTLSGTPMKSVADERQLEKSQIKPNRILRQNRIEQPIIQLERLELESLEDEETPEISVSLNMVETADGLKLDEPVTSIINELIEGSAPNCDNSPENCPANKCFPENLSRQSNISFFLPGACRDSEKRNFEKSQSMPIPTNRTSNHKCKPSMLASHPQSANLRTTQNPYSQEICDMISQKTNDSNAKPQNKTINDHIKIPHEENLERPLLFFPSNTNPYSNYQQQANGQRYFPQVVHNQKRKYQEFVATKPSSSHYIPYQINVPSHSHTLDKAYNSPSAHIPDPSIAKKYRVESNTQHIRNIQELINKTVHKSLPVPNHSQNAFQVTTPQNNIEHYYPNQNRQVFNMPQISAATSLSHLAHQSRIIDQSQVLYRPCNPLNHYHQTYQMQHHKADRDIYRQPYAFQNIYHKRYPLPSIKKAAQNQPSFNIIQPEHFTLKNQNHYQPTDRNYWKEVPKLQTRPIDVTKPYHHNLCYQNNIQNTVQRSDTSKPSKNPKDQINIQNDYLLQTNKNIQNPQEIVKTQFVPSSTSFEHNSIPQKNFETISKRVESVPLTQTTAQTEHSLNRPHMEPSLVRRNSEVSADRDSNDIVGNNNPIQTSISTKNNLEKNTEHVRQKTEKKEHTKSRLAAEQEMLDAFSALFNDMASNLYYTATMFNTIKSSVSEMNETYELLEKKIHLLNSIEDINGFSKKVTINDPEKITSNIPDSSKDKSSENKMNKQADDDCDAHNKNRGHGDSFVLPPEYDPKDSRWTLKYREEKPGLVELIPGGGIYVKKTELTKILRKATDRKTLAVMLLEEIFSRNALSVCSLTGSKARAFGSQIKFVRPGLDENARCVLLHFVEQYKEKRSRNSWKGKKEEKETITIMNAIRAKINWCREKWGLTPQKQAK